MLEPTPAVSGPPARRHRNVTVVAVAVTAAVVALFAAWPPHPVLDKADVFGLAICHRIPQRSFFLAGRQLPLCARCTGTFLGALLGLAALLVRRRPRASGLPPAGILVVLLGFMGLWAADGLNSYLGLIPGAPQLYEPRNWLRLATGMLNGLAISALVLPVLNFTLWRDPDPRPSIENAWELLAVLPPAAALVWLVRAEIGALLYPLVLLSSGGVLMVLTSLNTMLAVVILRREGSARTGRQALIPIGLGVALSLIEVAALAALRVYLVNRFGLVLEEPGR